MDALRCALKGRCEEVLLLLRTTEGRDRLLEVMKDAAGNISKMYGYPDPDADVMVAHERRHPTWSHVDGVLLALGDGPVEDQTTTLTLITGPVGALTWLVDERHMAGRKSQDLGEGTTRGRPSWQHPR